MRGTVSLLSITRIVFLSLIFLCVLIIDAQAKDNGVADYKKGMDLYAKDHDRALPLFKKAAMEGNADGMFMLGKLYENYHSEFSHDYANALKWYRTAAALGNTAAMNRLGFLYANGVVGYINNGDGNTKDQDAEMAKRWFNKAADLGDSDGMFNMARLYVEDDVIPQDYTKAEQWYKKAAALGNTNAMAALGFLRKVEGKLDSDKKAVYWFKKAAMIGVTGAMINVGNAYLEGKGVRQDSAQALKWYKKAIANGAEAQGTYSISAMYDAGKGAPQTDALRKYWRKRALNKFIKPWNEKRRRERELYQEEAANGNAKAMYELGNIYHNGTGVGDDIKMAAYWYRKATAGGSVGAMYQLGLIYDRARGLTYGERGVKRDYSQAMLYFQMAAISGHVGAMFFIGNLYNQGHGVEQNRDIAIIWWKRAAQHGNIPACRAMRFVKKMENQNSS